MARNHIQPSLTPEAAWQRLLGKWVARLDAGGANRDWCENRIEFTEDRRWIRTNLLAGGVLPQIQRNESVTQIVDVAVEGEDVRITLGAKSNPLARPGGTMTVRFPDADSLMIEDGPVYHRIAQFKDTPAR